MKTITESKRLMLREFKLSDALSMFELNNDPEVIRYTGDGPFQSISEAGKFIENYSDYRKNGYGRWAVISKETGDFLGWCGLKLNEEGMKDIGFRFFRAHWNKGYATESALAVLRYGFNKLHMKEIIGRAAVENNSSIRVLEKLGMKFWKIGSCQGIENSVYYKIRKHEFNELENHTSTISG